MLEAIERCDAMLVLLTANGYASTFVHQEIGAAQLGRKPIFALVEQEVFDRDRGMLEGAEVIVMNEHDLGASSATLIASLRRLSIKRGLTPPTLELSMQPALQLELSLRFELTRNQVLMGLLLLTACAGIVYLASREGGGSIPSSI